MMKVKRVVLSVVVLVIVACGANDGKAQVGGHDMSTVSFATIPTELDFAGESVPLELSEVREALEREISVTMYMHSRTLLTLRATKRYFPVIEKILKQYGVPDDFKYLCMAESGLNPNAQSAAKAVGLWQFVPSAAKDFGVETGENVDLRYDVEKITVAAAQYLKKAYQRYGSWTMVAASYNAGMAGVTRRANAQGVDNYYDLFLPEETMRYVFRVLSMKLVEQNPQQYGFSLKKQNYLKPFVNYTVIKVNDENLNWSEFAARHNTNYKVLRILNPWIRSYEYDNKGRKSYAVRVPNSDFRVKGY